MRDLRELVESVRTDLDEHDHLTKTFGVEPSDRADVLRGDVEDLLSIVSALPDMLPHDPALVCRVYFTRHAYALSSRLVAKGLVRQCPACVLGALCGVEAQRV